MVRSSSADLTAAIDTVFEKSQQTAVCDQTGLSYGNIACIVGVKKL